MNRNLILALIALGIGAFGWQQNYRNQADQASTSMQPSAGKTSCTGKELCGIIYVAPWCPACKQSAPVFKKMLGQSWQNKSHGMQVFVGKGEPQQNLEEAITYGPGATADQDNSQFQALKIRQFPSFFVADAKGNVVKRDQDAIEWMIRNFHSQH